MSEQDSISPPGVLATACRHRTHTHTSGSMSGVWKRKHGGAREAPADERAATDRFNLNYRATPRLHKLSRTGSGVTLSTTYNVRHGLVAKLRPKWPPLHHALKACCSFS